MAAAAAGADAVVMAAAVADYRPAVRHDSKIKKTGAGPEPIALTENPDILRELSARRGSGQVTSHFAPETEDLAGNGRAKLAGKGCDLLVVNQVGGGSRSAPTTTRRWYWPPTAWSPISPRPQGRACRRGLGTWSRPGFPDSD